MERIVALAVMLTTLLTAVPARAQEFLAEACVQVGAPVTSTLHLSLVSYPFTVSPFNAFSIVGTNSATFNPVHGSGYVLTGEGTSAGHFTVTVGPSYVVDGRPAMFLRGFVNLQSGTGSGVCQQRAGDVPCGEKATVSFTLCH